MKSKAEPCLRSDFIIIGMRGDALSYSLDCQLIFAEEEPFTDEEIAGLEESEESESSESLWDEYRKHRHEAISLEEYCRQRKIDL